MTTKQSPGRHTPGQPTTTTVTARVQAARRPRRAAFASLYAPAGRRRWWWYSYRCPACHSYQFGRARELDQVTGVRKAGCGHEIEILIARTYRSPEAS